MGNGRIKFPCIRISLSIFFTSPPLEISIVGCTGFSPLEVERALELMASGKINVKPLITHKFPLEQAQVAFEFLDRNGQNAIKAVLLP